MSDVNQLPNNSDDENYRYTNRLIYSASPYLLQHAHNPVDWYPWEEEALAEAQTKDKPILLSVGYAACHWCHVMAHESFENEQIAAIMNTNFVNIKVDREERPDLDAIFMEVTQLITHRGGWPMTVFLTPEGLPFYAGTYFPPQDRYGIPGFATILNKMAEFFKTNREEVYAQAESIKQYFETRDRELLQHIPDTSIVIDAEALDTATKTLLQDFDSQRGGFRAAPKFPHTMNLEFLLHMYVRQSDQPEAESAAAQPTEVSPIEAVRQSLDAMLRGGIYDQIGGGFHRYSTDAEWVVPHFEKMLYDNALLARLYLHAYQITGDERYSRICRETLDYLRRDMIHPDGGFYASQDADSEGEEGKFYVWTPKQVEEVLEPIDAEIIKSYYGVTATGNFENSKTTVLTRAKNLEAIAADIAMPAEKVRARIAEAKLALFVARSKRVWPNTDDKIITSWNGLALRAFAEASEVFESETYAEIAVTNATFLLENMRSSKNRLLRSYRNGKAHIHAFLEDYASLALGLLATYEATFDPHWFSAAQELVNEMITLFSNEDGAGFYDTPRDHEKLLTKPKEIFDNAAPSGLSMAVEALLWLAAVTGNTEYRSRAEKILLPLIPEMTRNPLFFGHLLCQLDRWLSPSQEIAIIGHLDDNDTRDLLASVRSRYRPNSYLACAGPGDTEAARIIPLLQNRQQIQGKSTAFVCMGFVCKMPVTGKKELLAQLGDTGV